MNDQTKFEEKWYRFWEESGFFTANPNSTKTPYSLLMPPPNLTGELHLGHAMQHSILDAVARFKRMQGYDVLLLPGVDHAGIQFEGTLNKLLSKEGITKEKLGREEWLKRAWKFKDEVYQSFHDVWTIMGISADWSREVFTLDEKVSEAVLNEFKTFWEDGLLYKGAYIVQWCPKCNTAIEDVEMEYQQRKENLFYINYQIDGTIDQFITIATVRPETIFADSGIAIYPHHPKYSKFINSKAINPLTGKKIPIFEDKRVEKNFGTGALKVTPGHDPLDFKIGKEHNLPILHTIDKQGRMTLLSKVESDKKNIPNQSLVGLRSEEARNLISGILQELGSLDRIEEYSHTVPVCERCKTVIEPLISEEWFVKMKSIAKESLEKIEKINFYPPCYKKIIASWIREIHDWSISRSLWWGYRIPVWYCQVCNTSKEADKNSAIAISIQEPTHPCPKCKSSKWIQEEKVLDTWFSSAIWPLATLGWPKKTPELARYFPWNFEISAGDIKYLWIARMIILSSHFKNSIPFKDMFFTGNLRDLQGRKFSKSLGNGIDPNSLREVWGTDATRMALYTYSAPGRDGRLSRQVMDQRCKSFRNFKTKLENLFKYIIELKPEEKHFPTDFSNHEEKEIIKSLNQTIKAVTNHLDRFELHLGVEDLYEFIWHKFADLYVEQSKKRRVESQLCLEFTFKVSLQLLHPFMPFITEELWQKMPHKEKSITISQWPRQNILESTTSEI